MNRSRTFLGAFLCVAAIASASCGSDSEPADPPSSEVEASVATSAAADRGLVDVLDEVVAETGVPGVGLAVVSTDGVEDLAVSGVRDLDSGAALEEEDPFHLGSNAKAMTAALLGRLVDEDLGLGFETTLGEAFGPSFEVDGSYDEVTLRDLLAHAGGAPTDDEATVEVGELAGPVVDQRLEATKAVLTSAPAVEPGTEYRYSNAGYVIVGSAMEQATGRSWEDLMRAELFEPLSMASCGFGPPGGDQPDGVPMGHDSNDQPTDQDAPALLGPAGTVHCSLEDWAKFVQELLLAADGEGELLAPETAQILLSTHPVPVGEDEGFEAGLGWTIQQGPSGPVYSYDGSNTYWFSQALMVPGSGRALLGASNQEGSGMGALAVALAAAAEMYPA